MDEIETKGLILVIKEYDKIIRQYQDTNYDRFKQVSLELINDHIKNNSKQSYNEIKNLTIRLYTY